MPRRYVRPLGYGGIMNTYKVYFRGRFKKHFHDRDQALAWIATEVRMGSDFEDFEILDGSDEA